MEIERLQEQLRKIARSKWWMQNPDFIFVDYDWREELYGMTVYWIENDKMMIGYRDIMPGDDLSEALDETRQSKKEAENGQPRGR